jgi:ADP-heptose:LPS heptosyltransferase
MALPFENIRQRIGIKVARLHFRKKATPQTDFTHSFSNARSALVIVPENSEHRSMAIPLLASLQNKFRGNRLTIVIHDSFRDLSSSLAHCNVIALRKEHRGFFFLPKRSVVKDIARQEYDLAIDLNIPMVITAAYLCRSSKAVLKVGFVKKESDIFYNFQMNVSPQKSPRLQYEQLLHTMAMF